MKSDFSAGRVYLVGAGPGDPELLTVKAYRILQTCDVIIYDALVNTSILRLSPPHAEHIFVGQPRTDHRMSQKQVEALMLKKAYEGKSVVRLKGGDPFIFGRGGEEALALACEGIPFEIIPGVSAGSAVPAYAGIPLTHRGLAASVAFVTGHQCDQQNPAVDLKAISASVDTLVVFMGVAKLRHIIKAILDSGRPGSTPMAIIEQGTTIGQQTRIMTLKTVDAELIRNPVSTPALLIVGEVVNLQDSIAWFRSQYVSRFIPKDYVEVHDELPSGIS